MADDSKRPIDLYYWPTPNGWKASIMVEECGLDYRVIPINIGAGAQFDPEFLAISPNNKIPAIVDHDGPNGRSIAIFESGAILKYLAQKTGLFYPKDSGRQALVDQWLFWQVGGLGPMLGQANHFLHHTPEPIPYAADRYVREGARLLGVLNKHLSDCEFVADDYSIADIAIFSWTTNTPRQGQTLESFPNIVRWKNQIQSRPAVQRGLEIRTAGQGTYDMKDPAVRAILFGERSSAEKS